MKKKKISIEQIKTGKLVGTPVSVSVTIHLDGEECEFDTHIKPFGYAAVVARWQALGEKKAALAGTISSCICDATGKLLFTEQQVSENFSEELIEALWAKIYDVNNIGGKSKKMNSETMKSSQNSPSTELAETASKPSKKTSRTKKSVTGGNTYTEEGVSTSVDESSK